MAVAKIKLDLANLDAVKDRLWRLEVCGTCRHYDDGTRTCDDAASDDGAALTVRLHQHCVFGESKWQGYWLKQGLDAGVVPIVDLP